MDEHHTLRGGFLAQVERTSSRATTSVLPVDELGVQTTDQPVQIGDKNARTGGFYGIYLQDEWRILPRVTLNYGARGDVVDEYTHEARVSCASCRSATLVRGWQLLWAKLPSSM